MSHAFLFKHLRQKDLRIFVHNERDDSRRNNSKRVRYNSSPLLALFFLAHPLKTGDKPFVECQEPFIPPSLPQNIRQSTVLTGSVILLHARSYRLIRIRDRTS